MSNNLIPFDYQTWKTGNYDVVYRNGEVPLEWHFYERANRIVSFGSGGALISHETDGVAHVDNVRFYDLMLRPKDKWIEGYATIDGGVFQAVWNKLENAQKFNTEIVHLRWNPITKQGTITEV